MMQEVAELQLDLFVNPHVEDTLAVLILAPFLVSGVPGGWVNHYQ